MYIFVAWINWQTTPHGEQTRSPESRRGLTMTEDAIDVLVFLNEASESSIPLQVASDIQEPDVDVHVCSFFEPDDNTFGVDVEWLGARSQFDPLAYYRLVKFVRTIDPDVVHIHPNASGSVARVLLSAVGPALVSTEHNVHDHFGRLKRVVNGITNPLNDVVVANSETTRDSLSGWESALLSLTNTPVQVIHNGVDIEAITAASNQATVSSLPDGFLVGTAGRLVPQKNQSALVRAAAPLLRDRDDSALVIVGDGPLRAELEAVAAELGISDQTHFLGYLPERTDVYAVMDELDVFVFPSQYEGFGVAIAEAMALGTPVVANDIPILREVVGDAGVFLDVSDTAAFAAALTDLAENDCRRTELARRGSERIERRFSLERTVEEHVRMYRRIARGDGTEFT
ncbi:glycosyltransferase [Halomicrobium salinisoli]|uniref:glycosyltransferase n=1 Tax=Halomicrobium salinisoli TaxID=2878391 RepID=UPI001CF0BDE2|nr:glycosyltransferase [Halomicrobium salinisoli]